MTLSALLGALAVAGGSAPIAGAAGVAAYASSSSGAANTVNAGGTHAPKRHDRANSSCRGNAAEKRRARRSGKSGCAASRHHPAAKKSRTTATRSSAKSAAEAAASEAATIANVLATPCQNTQLTPEPANLALVRAAVLCLINTERAQNGREPLQADPHLEAAAESHGREMISLDYFDHIAPSGETPVERDRGEGYIPNAEVGYVIGENLAWGTLTLSTPEAIVKAWIASPEHLANILEAKYRQTGIDVEPEVPTALAEGVPGALYTQEFGVIIH